MNDAKNPMLANAFHRILSPNYHALRRFMLVAGIGVFALQIFFRLGHGSIDLWDEALTAARSLYVYQTNSIFNIEANGELSIRKPPFTYVLNALSFKLLGISIFSLRLPNALFSLATVLVFVLLARELLDDRYTFLAPWLLLGSYGFLEVSREALTDSLYIFSFMLVSLSIHYALDGSARLNFRAQLGFTMAIALALLSKGVPGFFLAAYTLAFLSLFYRQLLIRYLLLSILSSLPFIAWLSWQWHLTESMMNTVLQQEYLERLNYDSRFLPNHIQSPFWYIEELYRHHRLVGVFGGLGLVGLLVSPFFRRLGWRMSQVSLSWVYIVGLCVIYLVSISYIPHKQERYILPLFPFFILFFLFWFKVFWETGSCRVQQAASALLILTLVFAIYVNLHKYDAVPDYHPHEKLLAQKLGPYVELQGLQPYTDTRSRALLIHFYLQRRVKYGVNPEALPPGSVWIGGESSDTRSYIVY